MRLCQAECVRQLADAQLIVTQQQDQAAQARVIGQAGEQGVGIDIDTNNIRSSLYMENKIYERKLRS
jgi:hypothetical protein